MLACWLRFDTLVSDAELVLLHGRQRDLAACLPRELAEVQTQEGPYEAFNVVAFAQGLFLQHLQQSLEEMLAL